MWTLLSATLSKVLTGSIQNLLGIPNLVKAHNCCPHSEDLVQVPSYQPRVHEFPQPCLCDYPSHDHETRTYPGCMNWLVGVHSLWWDTMFIFDAVGEGLSSASTLYADFAYFPREDLPSPRSGWRDGMGRGCGKRERSRNWSWSIKWKQKHFFKKKITQTNFL